MVRIRGIRSRGNIRWQRRWQMAKRWIITILMAALSLAACMPVTPAGQAPATAAPAGAETPPPAEEATVEATSEATEEVMEEATTEAEEATVEPEGETAEGEVDIAAVVSQLLAEELQIDPATIEVVSVE